MGRRSGEVSLRRTRAGQVLGGRTAVGERLAGQHAMPQPREAERVGQAEDADPTRIEHREWPAPRVAQPREARAATLVQTDEGARLEAPEVEA